MHVLNRHVARWAVLLTLWAVGSAQGQHITDTFTRDDGTAIGATETPTPGIPYVERSTTGAAADVASLVGGQLYISGDGTAPVLFAPGQAVLHINAPNLAISADFRFGFDDPATTQASVMCGFNLRKPTSTGNINDTSSLGQINIDFTPAGGLLIRQRDSGALTVLFTDNPWQSGSQAVAALQTFTTPGTLPATINGLPFDVDQDGKLESTEPFRLGAVLSGTSLQVLVNGSVIASTNVSGTGSTGSNYFAVMKNKWTSTTAGYTGCHVYADNLQVSILNDTCVGAIPIADGVTYGGTAALPNMAPSSASCGDSNATPAVWYAYTATCTGDLSIDTCGSSYDTVVSVLDSCNGSEMACNDQCPGTPCTGNSSCLLVPVTQGTVYYLRVSGHAGATGTFRLTLRCGPAPTPANDSCANATVIGRGTITGTTLGATSDGSAGCGNSSGSPDVWYSYTPSYASNLLINTCGTLYDTVVSVHSACGGAELACNRDCQDAALCGGPASCLSAAVQPGQPYLIRVAGADGHSGPFTLSLLEDVVIRHVGQANPTTEGWTLGSNSALNVTQPGSEGEDHWSMSAPTGALVNYARTLTAAETGHPHGWTATWRAKAVAAPDVYQAGMLVDDGARSWALQLSDGTSTRPKGLYMLRTGSAWVQVSDMDPRDAFHTYQIVYDPISTNGFFFVDGTMIARLPRSEANATTNRRFLVGDASSSGPASQSLWSYGDFAIRREPLAPANDHCDSAAVLATGVNQGATFGASADGNASCGDSATSPDVWYAYTASCTGDLILDTCGSLMNTVLSVYTGTCAAGSELVCNDNCGGSPCNGSASCVSIPVMSGQQLLIRVAGAGGAVGGFQLQARCGVPANDACAAAQPITKGTVQGTTSLASPDGSASCGSSNSPDVWYQYYAPEDTTVRLDTCGSGIPTVLSVHTACGGSELACNAGCTDPACTGGACLTFPAQAGVAYLIRVAGVGGAEGNFQLTLKDSVIMQHLGTDSPTAVEGWTDTLTGNVTRTGGNDGTNHWRMQAGTGSGSVYAANVTSGQMTVADFQDPNGWTMTATLRAIQAPDAFECVFYVADGQSLWGLSMVTRDLIGQRGIYRVPAVIESISSADLLADVDPADGYHTYQMVFDPAGNGGAGSVTYYLDGVPVATDTRAAVPARTDRFIQWGDGTSTTGRLFGGTNATQCHWAFVRFERGQKVRLGPRSLNDTCEQATAVGTGEFFGLTAGANADGAAGCGSSNASPDIWYNYTATCTGNLVVDTCGSVLDTVVSVHSGCGGAQLACNDNTCGTQSRIVLPVTEGNQYRIRLAANSGAAGPIRFHVACGIPANDTCANAFTVNGGATQGTTLGATPDGTASCGNSNASADVWYRYVATCNAPLEVNTCGSGFDTVVSLYTGCAGAELACADDGCGKQSRVETNATAGTTYFIRVSGANYSQGDFTMNVLCKQPPPNDVCSSAITLVEGTTAGTTMFATPDGDAICGGQGSVNSPDVWYLYTASRSGRLKIDASDANFTPTLSLHQPASCPGGLENQIACGSPILTHTVQQGAVYLLRVAGVGNTSGSFNLKVGFDQVVIKHEGTHNPVSEGWTRDTNNTAAMTEGGADDGQPHWFLTQVDTARLNYQFTGLTSGDFSDPAGWTMTAVAKAVVASTVWQAHLLLQDGQDTWTIHLIDGTGTAPRGVYITGTTLTTMIQISDLDPTAAYHRYQIAYNPKTQTATYIIDGTVAYTQTREEATDSTLRRVVWGDNASAGGPSFSKWNLVQFEFGTQVVGCYDPLFDADGDTDVDMVDFAAFQACYTVVGTVSEECACFDVNRDDVVDAVDFGVFENCASGSGVPALPNCDN